jgi:hypothetical protein
MKAVIRPAGPPRELLGDDLLEQVGEVHDLLAVELPHGGARRAGLLSGLDQVAGGRLQHIGIRCCRRGRGVERDGGDGEGLDGPPAERTQVPGPQHDRGERGPCMRTSRSDVSRFWSSSISASRRRRPAIGSPAGATSPSRTSPGRPPRVHDVARAGNAQKQPPESIAVPRRRYGPGRVSALRNPANPKLGTTPIGVRTGKIVLRIPQNSLPLIDGPA